MRSMLVTVGLLCGCASSSPPAETPPVPSAQTPIVSSAAPAASSTSTPAPASPPPPIAATGDEPTRAAERVPRTEPTTYIARGKSVTLKGLTVSVADMVVKRTMEGGEMLRVSARLAAGGKQTEISFESDAGALEWNGYLVEMRGGSTEGAGFAVVRLSK